MDYLGQSDKTQEFLIAACIITDRRLNGVKFSEITDTIDHLFKNDSKYQEIKTNFGDNFFCQSTLLVYAMPIARELYRKMYPQITHLINSEEYTISTDKRAVVIAHCSSK